MTKHFENLWEEAEKNFSASLDDPEAIITKIILRVNLYKNLVIQQKNISKEDLDKIKSHIMGEILLALAHLSLKENINVFQSLQTALHFSDIEKYKDMYQSSPP
jgi:hypothetical protein